MDDRDRQYSRPMWIPWAMTSLALLVVAVIAYVMGTRHEEIVGASGEVHHHFGFGGIFWLFLVFWFVFGFRRAYWWGGPPYYRPWRYRRYRRMYGDLDDEEREWREWHRREHERTATAPPTDGARGQG